MTLALGGQSSNTAEGIDIQKAQFIHNTKFFYEAVIRLTRRRNNLTREQNS